MKITDVSKLRGPLGELHDQILGENGEERLAELNLWLKRVTTGTFRRDMRKKSWTLLENSPRRLSSAINGIPFLKNGDSSIGGEEMVRRAIELDANYGQEDAEWLLENQDKIPAELRKFYLVFSATIWRDANGRRFVPYLVWYGARWFLYFHWLDDVFGSNHRLVRPRR